MSKDIALGTTGERAALFFSTVFLVLWINAYIALSNHSLKMYPIVNENYGRRESNIEMNQRQNPSSVGL